MHSDELVQQGIDLVDEALKDMKQCAAKAKAEATLRARSGFEIQK